MAEGGKHDPLQEARAENKRLQEWIADLQSGMYVNCVYCGHRYGPGETTPVSMADALKTHVEQCPDHPMSKLRAALAFYADPDSWENWLWPDEGYNSRAKEDGGDKARNALGGSCLATATTLRVR